jgi:PAS domain S-box-containing protein
MSNKTRILVVEDESIVAKDIQKSLEKLGYEVPATASSAATAYEKLDELNPDLVFLDIRLKGEQDGIDIAGYIKDRFEIPVIFLTSYVDQETLDRAKHTEPYGYIVKPFNESDLKTTVEMALFKFSRDREVRASQQRLANALALVDEMIMVVDSAGNINYVNERAEKLLGLSSAAASGSPVFQLVGFSDNAGKPVELNALMDRMRADSPWDNDQAVLSIRKSGQNIQGSISISPIHDEKNQFLGCAIVFSDNAVSKSVSTDESASTSLLDSQVIHNSFFVKKGSMLVKVFLDNIQWIQAMDNYVIIQTTSDQFVIHSTMKDIESKLPSSKFLRVHRSYIIPIDKINVLDENTVLIGDKTIPIGKSYKDTFMARLNFL